MIEFETGDAPDPAMLAALSSGRGDPAIGLFLETALALRGRSEPAAEAFAGAMLEAEAPAELADGALERAFARIDGAVPEATPGSRQGSFAPQHLELIRMPPALLERIVAAEANTGWRARGPDISILPLATGGKVRAEVIRIQPKAAVFRHTHLGGEATLCLHGGFSDHRGSYGVGDVCSADPNVTHRPVADDDGACFVLAITDAGLKFTGLVGLVQRLIGF